ncbi:hypothetical protein N2152v2_003598 [Parachlorella kessleri]
MAEEGATCEVCWQGSLVLQQGALGFVEETQEYQGGTQTFFHRRSVRGAAGRDKQYEQREAPKLAEAAMAYVHCLQRLLQRQATALRDVLGINPLVLGALEQLWLAYLPLTEVLEESFTRKLEERIKPPQQQQQQQPPQQQQQQQEEEGEAAAVAGEATIRPAVAATADAGGRTAALVLGEGLRHALPPGVTLSLCFLACWQLREAVSPQDLVRWALNGQLPFWELARLSRAAVEEYAAVLPLAFLDPRGVPSPTRVWDEAVLIAARIGLRCPPLNVGLWLDRWTQELALPQAVGVVGLQLYQLYRLDCPQYHLQYRVLAQAHTHAMALLLVAVKLLYGLDGRRREVVEGLPPPPDWLHWARVVMGSLQGPTALPLALEEAMDLPDAVFQLYLDFLSSHAFGSRAVPEELQEFQRALQRLAEAHAQQQQQQQQQQQRPEQEARAHQQQQQWTEQEARAQQQQQHQQPAQHSQRQPVDQHTQQPLRQGPQHSQQPREQPSSPAGPALEPFPLPSSDGSEPLCRGSGSPLSLGAQPPPALPAGAYPVFGRAFGKGGSRVPISVPLDYAAVLTVCAALLGVVPNLLHSLVSELEHGMVHAEAEVAYAADPQAQGRLQAFQKVLAEARERTAEYEGALQEVREQQPDILPGFTAAAEELSKGRTAGRGRRGKGAARPAAAQAAPA